MGMHYDQTSLSAAGSALRNWPEHRLTRLFDLPSGVYWMWVACWGLLASVFLITFLHEAHLHVVFAVIAGFAAMFFGVPAWMARMSNRVAHDKRKNANLAIFMDQWVATATGTIRGRDALIQIVTVPLALALGTFVISLIVESARAGVALP